jgi:uncharacterized protein
MKNVIGSVATGDDFYPRDSEINLIYQRLEAGGNLYLNAPRRVGKTSIMKYLLHNPRPSYLFVYKDFEGCESADEFFQQLVEALLNSDLKHPPHARLADKTKKWVKSNLPSIKGIEIPGIKLELGEKDPIDWAALCARLLVSLPEKDQRIVILVDEYPQVIENIIAKQHASAASSFLHQHRALRQEATLKSKVQFILTGSINLSNSVSKVSDLKVVNDLDHIQVGPLTQAQAGDMVRRLFEAYHLIADEATIRQLVGRIDWPIPFHIQLWMKGIIEQLDPPKRHIVNAAVVDLALERMFDPANRPYFDQYFRRLTQAYTGDELRFVHQLLNLCADTARIRMPTAKDLAEQHNSTSRFYEILDSLFLDGYLAETKDEIHFRSMILKEWWHRYESRKHR